LISLCLLRVIDFILLLTRNWPMLWMHFRWFIFIGGSLNAWAGWG
jgi:hypothetical protein